MIFKDKKLLIICNTFRGRRLKFYELQHRMFDNILILAGHNIPGYKNLLVYNNMEQLKDLTLRFDPDIVHCNIDNSAPAKAIQHLGYKTILDIHDYSKLRGIADINSKEVYENAKYIIFVNGWIEDIIKLNATIKRSITIPSLVPKSWMIKRKAKSINYSFVHVGSLAKSVEYRNLDAIFEKIYNELDIEVNIYSPCGKSSFNHVIYHNPIFEGKNFYREISKYHIGIVAVNPNVSQLELDYAKKYGLANRVFDYMAARIKTLGINMGGMANSYINNWGIAINDTDDLMESAVELINKKIDFDYWQNEFNLDNYYNDLKNIYHAVLNEK